jgi:hypothetical protein
VGVELLLTRNVEMSFLKAPMQKITSLCAWKGKIKKIPTMKGRSENIILFFQKRPKPQAH